MRPANENAATMDADTRAEYLEKLLAFARKTARGKLLVSGLRPLVVSTERSKDRRLVPVRGRPMRAPGFVTLQLDDDAVRDLSPQGEGEDAWFLVRCRRSVLDRFESPILSPEETIS